MINRLARPDGTERGFATLVKRVGAKSVARSAYGTSRERPRENRLLLRRPRCSNGNSNNNEFRFRGRPSLVRLRRVHFDGTAETPEQSDYDDDDDDDSKPAPVVVRRLLHFYSTTFASCRYYTLTRRCVFGSVTFELRPRRDTLGGWW